VSRRLGETNVSKLYGRPEEHVVSVLRNPLTPSLAPPNSRPEHCKHAVRVVERAGSENNKLSRSSVKVWVQSPRTHLINNAAAVKLTVQVTSINPHLPKKWEQRLYNCTVSCLQHRSSNVPRADIILLNGKVLAVAWPKWFPCVGKRVPQGSQDVATAVQPSRFGRAITSLCDAAVPTSLAPGVLCSAYF
jgi:hypothetical protein